MFSRRSRPKGGAWARALAPLALAAVLAACGGAPSAQSYFDAGARKFQAKDYDGAIAAYQQGLRLEPRSAVGQNLLGMAYRFKYNAVRDSQYKEKEIAAFEAAVAADSTFVAAQINLGATLYYLGRKAEAAPHFRRALELQPDNPEREQLEGFIREGGLEPPER
jgi:tetratricopeptide (TPR) repeat protein